MEVKNQVGIEPIKVHLRTEVFKFCEWLIEITQLSVKENLRSPALFYTEMDQDGLHSQLCLSCGDSTLQLSVVTVFPTLPTKTLLSLLRQRRGI